MKHKKKEILKIVIVSTIFLALILAGQGTIGKSPNPPDGNDASGITLKPLTYNTQDKITFNVGVIAEAFAKAGPFNQSDESNSNSYVEEKTSDLYPTGGSSTWALIGLNVEDEDYWAEGQESNYAKAMISGNSEITAHATSNSLSIVGSAQSNPIEAIAKDVSNGQGGIDLTTSEAIATFSSSPTYKATIPFIVTESCHVIGSVCLWTLAGLLPEADLFETNAKISWSITGAYGGSGKIELKTPNDLENKYISGLINSGSHQLKVTFEFGHLLKGSAGNNDSDNALSTSMMSAFMVNLHFKPFDTETR